MKLFFVFLFTSAMAFSQELGDTAIGQLYRNSFAVGVNFNTAGWGFCGEVTKQKNYKYHHVLGLHVSNIRHRNEFKTSTASSVGTFWFYKLNSFVVIRPTIGGNLRLFEIRRDNGIEVRYKWKIGPSLGLLKPVFVEIGTQGLVTREERYDPEEHGFSDIESRSGWFRGLGQSTVQFGIHSKHGFNFNFAQQENGISGGEIGFLFDYYPFNEVEIMYEARNFKLFTGFYLQFELGNKF